MAHQLATTLGHVILVDDCDLERAAAHRWYASADSRGNIRAFTCVGRGPAKRSVWLARLIMEPPPEKVVDHVNGDTLDNRRANLRVCDVVQNVWNSKRPVTNTSGFKGVRLNKRSGNYIARIQAKPRDIHIGSFATAEDAARAYDKAARNLHGEFARLNFPLEDSAGTTLESRGRSAIARWTPGEIGALRAAANGGSSAREAAASLGRPYWSCMQKAKREGISFSRAPNNPEDWP